jgi:hypothetical protein
MSYRCSDCGKVHDELPRHFMWKKPETKGGKVVAGELSRKSMYRGETGCFVLCEVELPLTDNDGAVLGLICWVEVTARAYEKLLDYRSNEDAALPYTTRVPGQLANRLPAIPGSWGTRVRFEVKKGDPTPYIKWVAPGSSLAKRVATGASHRFWHAVVAFFAT